jgi:hypothetical protein
VITFKLILLTKKVPTRALRGGFQFLMILDLWGISFHAAVVYGLGKDFLFKYTLGHCDKCRLSLLEIIMNYYLVTNHHIQNLNILWFFYIPCWLNLEFDILFNLLHFVSGSVFISEASENLKAN